MGRAGIADRAAATLRGPWGAALGGAVILSLAVWALQGAATDPGSAQAGSPFYDRAVRGASKGLVDLGADAPGAAAEPCPDCGEVHEEAPAAGVGDPNAPAEVCPDCGQVHAPVAAPHPEQPLDQPEGAYGYCEDCGTYHARDEAGPAPPEQPPK